MTESSTSAVEQAVQARIAAVKIRAATAKQQRDELSAARRRGLAARHANKLRRLAEAEQWRQDDEVLSRSRNNPSDQADEPEETT